MATLGNPQRVAGGTSPARALTRQDAAPELAVIVPTLNERDNLVPLLDRLEHALAGVNYEVLFVDDDSSDGTADFIRRLGQTRPEVRVLQRIGRRGLSSACLEGMLATNAPVLAVMDADLQHDERILPQMLEKIRGGSYDLVIGSRNTVGGSTGEFSRERVALSNLGLRLSQLVSHHRLSDPMSGYFILTRELLNRVVHRTTGTGFKILLDLVASSSEPVRFAEVGYTFRSRQHGESKLDINVGLEYLYLVADKRMGAWLPVRFVLFCLVGFTGVILNLGVLWLLYRHFSIPFEIALTWSIGVAMIGNFLVNNVLTYRDRRLRGWKMLSGFAFYGGACSVGAMSNYALTEFLAARTIWWPIAALAGLAVGSVWNFGASSILTWRTHQRRTRAVPAPPDRCSTVVS